MEIQFITIRNENEIIRIGIHELLYIKVDGSLINCYIDDGDKYYCSMSLRSFLLKLPEGGFFLISRNCLINLGKIRKFHRQKREVTLLDSSVHKVSERKVKQLLSYLK